MSDYLIWFIAGAILIVAEIVLPGFVIVWFGIGALGASLAAFLGAGHIVQVVVFILVSIASLIPAKIFLKKKEKEPALRVGAERLIGMIGRVTKPVKPGQFGEVKIDGDVWIVKADNEIAVDEEIIVDRIEGTHLVIHKKIQEQK